MQIPDFFRKCLYKGIFDILVDQDIVRGNARLAAVQGLSPGNALCRDLDVCRSVDYARTLSSKFQNNGCKILGCSGHYCLCKCRAAGEEDEVPSQSEQGGVDIPVALNHCNVLLFKGFRDHVCDYLRHVRNIW